MACPRVMVYRIYKRITIYYYKLNIKALGHVVSEMFLSHLSRRLIGEPLVYPCSDVRSCRRFRRGCYLQCSNISFDTIGQIKAKFHVEYPKEGRTKVYVKGPGHMTKMAAMNMYDKKLKTLKNLLFFNQWTDFSLLHV